MKIISVVLSSFIFVLVGFNVYQWRTIQTLQDDMENLATELNANLETKTNDLENRAEALEQASALLKQQIISLNQETQGVRSQISPGASQIQQVLSEELLRQTRDVTRISDLATLKSAVSLYLADAPNPSLCSRKGGVSVSTQGGTAVNGGGWLPVNFNAISSGSPLSKLPVDPKNSGSYYYSYSCDPQTQTFELNAHMESERYGRSGTNHIVTTDGGDNLDIYEAGTSPGLVLIH